MPAGVRYPPQHRHKYKCCEGLVLDIGPPMLHKDATTERDWFHKPCEDCDSADDSFGGECSSCKHLRLGHLVNCVFPTLDNDNDLLESSSRIITIDASWYWEDKEEQACCSLCRFMKDSISGFRGISHVGKQFRLEMQSTARLFPAFEEMGTDGPLEGLGDRSRVFSLVILTRLRSGSGISFNDIEIAPIEKPSFKPYRYVDWELIRNWELTSIGNFNPPSEFRVIDVARRCIISPPRPCWYVALSYVWGERTDKELESTVGNIQSLEMVGSLSNSMLPTTIRDAFIVCQELGYPYLWVDRLCILQDGGAHKQHQISSMDRIYAESAVTIVDATGEHARNGLSGVTRERKLPQMISSWEGLELVPPHPPIHEILAHSPWAKRGWTLQEEICAKRVMYFTDHGVFSVNKHGSTHRADSERRARTNLVAASPDYFSLVEQYTKRSLSCQTDILDAFMGVVNWLEPEYGDAHMYGIPLEVFDEGILWQQNDGIQGERLSDPSKWSSFGRLHHSGSSLQLMEGHLEDFPSWSWCSLAGPVNYDLGRIVVSLAAWAIPFSSPSSNFQTLVPVPFRPALKDMPNVDVFIRQIEIWEISAVAYAWKAGFWRKEHFTVGPDVPRPEELGCSTGLPKESYWNNPNNLKDMAVHEGVRPTKKGRVTFLDEFTPEDHATAFAKHGRILVFTEAALLDLQFYGHFESRHLFVLLLPNGTWAGIILLDPRISTNLVGSIPPRGVQRMEFLGLSVTLDNDIIQETVSAMDIELQAGYNDTWRPVTGSNFEEEEACDQDSSVSVNNGMEHDFWRIHDEEVNVLTEDGSLRRYEDGAETWTSARINVMLICRRNGVASRLGIGQVYMKRWKEANRSFCTTVLE